MRKIRDHTVSLIEDISTMTRDNKSINAFFVETALIKLPSNVSFETMEVWFLRTNHSDRNSSIARQLTPRLISPVSQPIDRSIELRLRPVSRIGVIGCSLHLDLDWNEIVK